MARVPLYLCGLGLALGGLAACLGGQVSDSQVPPVSPSTGGAPTVVQDSNTATPPAPVVPACTPAEASNVVLGVEISPYVTTADANLLLAAQPQLRFTSGQCPTANAVVVAVDRSKSLQAIAGFGASLTDSSARLLSTYLRFIDTKHAVLHQLFDPKVGLNLNLLHIDIGAGGFDSNGFTNYDPSFDPNLTNFSLAGAEQHYTFTVLDYIRNVKKDISLIAAPWSGPGWMKTNNNMVGGALNPNYWGVMSQYMLKCVQGFQAAGNTFYAVAPQNEPDTDGRSNGFNFPSSLLAPAAEAAFIHGYLGPLFAAQEPNIKILSFEGAWSDVAHPLTVLGNSQARSFIAGTAIHCDASNPNAQDALLSAFPDQEVWVTRCGRTEATTFAEDLEWFGTNMIVGALQHGATAVMMYNIALDPSNGPTRPVSCVKCRGMVQIDLSAPLATGLVLNVEYYAMGHVSKYVVPGAHRIASSQIGGPKVSNIAFVNPDGSVVTFLVNTDDQAAQIMIQDGLFSAPFALPAHALATLTWPQGS